MVRYTHIALVRPSLSPSRSVFMPIISGGWKIDQDRCLKCLYCLLFSPVISLITRPSVQYTPCQGSGNETIPSFAVWGVWERGQSVSSLVPRLSLSLAGSLGTRLVCPQPRSQPLPLLSSSLVPRLISSFLYEKEPGYEATLAGSLETRLACPQPHSQTLPLLSRESGNEVSLSPQANKTYQLVVRL